MKYTIIIILVVMVLSMVGCTKGPNYEDGFLAGAKWAGEQVGTKEQVNIKEQVDIKELDTISGVIAIRDSDTGIVLAGTIFKKTIIYLPPELPRFPIFIDCVFMECTIKGEEGWTNYFKNCWFRSSTLPPYEEMPNSIVE